MSFHHKGMHRFAVSQYWIVLGSSLYMSVGTIIASSLNNPFISWHTRYILLYLCISLRNSKDNWSLIALTVLGLILVRRIKRLYHNITSQPFYTNTMVFFNHVEVEWSYNLMKLQIPLFRWLFQPKNGLKELANPLFASLLRKASGFSMWKLSI